MLSLSFSPLPSGRGVGGEGAMVRAMPVILVIDVGLTNCKASLFDFTGRMLAASSTPYPTLNPRTGWSEQEPGAWWSALSHAVRDLLSAPQADSADVALIAVTAHMHGIVAVDANLQPLTTCWTLFDRRALDSAEALQRELTPERAFAITGARMEAYTPAAKIGWLKHHQPDVFARTALFLSPKDVLRVQLGGLPVTDPIDAAGTLLYDLTERAWSADIRAALGLPLEKLPSIEPSAGRAGALSLQAAAQLGLTAGIPLLVSAGDDIETLGAGLTEPGMTLEHIGTTGTLTTCLAQPIYDPARRVEVYPQALPDRNLLGGATNAAGRSLEWARRWLSSADHGDSLLLAYPPTAGSIDTPLYLPFINGERGLLWDAQASGAFFGLREAHTSAEMALAVYEGVAFSLKEILDANRRLGAPLTTLISGTPNSEPAWSQLRADLYGQTIHFPATSYLTGLGCALLALVQLGIFASPTEAAQKCCALVDQVEPDPERSAHYQRKFELYQAAIAATQPLFARLV